MSRPADRESIWQRATWQLSSLLLSYPDERLLGTTNLLGASVAKLPPAAGKPLAGAVQYVGENDLASLQAEYVATFDLRKRCSLYLTWWLHGDTRNRGRALLEFKTAYRDAGASPPGDELPDHLAVVLEFAAQVDETVGRQLLTSHIAALVLLDKALHGVKSPYAGVLDAVCATLPSPPEDVIASARRTAATGPPSERVGLEPFGGGVR